jgi:hypothetical protein
MNASSSGIQSAAHDDRVELRAAHPQLEALPSREIGEVRLPLEIEEGSEAAEDGQAEQEQRESGSESAHETSRRAARREPRVGTAILGAYARSAIMSGR